MEPPTPPGSPLLLNDVLQPGHHQLRGEGAESEACAAGLQGRDDLGEVVADEAKAGVFCELLDHCGEAGGEAGPCLQPRQGCHRLEGCQWRGVPGAPHLASGRSEHPGSWRRLHPG